MDNSSHNLYSKSVITNPNSKGDNPTGTPNSAPVVSNIYGGNSYPPTHPPGGFGGTQVLVLQGPPLGGGIHPIPHPFPPQPIIYPPGPYDPYREYPPPPPPQPEPKKPTKEDFPDPRQVCVGQSKSVRVFWPNWEKLINTKTGCSCGSKICLFSCILCCVLGPIWGIVPCLMSSCYEYPHYCSGCDKYLGTSKTGSF